MSDCVCMTPRFNDQDFDKQGIGVDTDKVGPKKNGLPEIRCNPLAFLASPRGFEPRLPP